MVETFHQTQDLRKLLARLSNKGSNPLQLIQADGDWNHDHLWAAATFLSKTARLKEALQVFEFWKNKETSRINETNYLRIVKLLCEANLMEEAVSMVKEMEDYGVASSRAIYNSIVHGLARAGDFESAEGIVRKMVEVGLVPGPETYNGLIQGYGNHGMLDEMSRCMKRMESDGCSPNEETYNTLIVQLAQARLVERMEKMSRTLLSKGMNVLPSTLVAVLEAYADLGILEKMEKAYQRVLKSKAFLKENLIRKLAMVYIENYRFIRLEELASETASRNGRTYLVWCLLLIASARLLSRKGIESVVQEMQVAKVRPHITFTNVIALGYMKIKAFKDLDCLLCQVGAQNIKPDMVTVGLLFEAFTKGYDGTRVIQTYRRNGFLDEAAELRTDPLVLAAFGKGFFLRRCEDLYSSLGSVSREKKIWTYNDLLSLVFNNTRRKSPPA